MRYFLKNKDKTVLSFDMQTITHMRLGEQESEHIIDNIEVIDSSYLPYGLKLDDLSAWIKSRKAPKNRQFIEKIIATYNNGDSDKTMDYIDVSLGLSLNDTFWVVSNDYKWSDYNLYENPFNKALALVAFNGESYKISGIVTSPEYTTNGALPKCWHKDENGKISLYKGQSKEYANGGKEAFCEYYCYQVATKMGLNATKYDLKEFCNKIVSSCEIFTSQNEGFVPIYHFLSLEAKKSKDERLIAEISDIYGKEAFCDLMVFDALIGNTDRHLGNFGMIVDNDAGKVLRPAPIFDNGYCVLNSFTKDDLKRADEAFCEYHSQLDIGFDAQLKYFLSNRHIEGLKRLTNFKLQKHMQFNLADEWMIMFESLIQNRAKMALKHLQDNDKSANSVGTNKHK